MEENIHEPVIDKCKENGGCTRIKDGVCAAYLYPDKKWKNGNCNLADNIETEKEKKKKINPIKYSKGRGRR
jgi:hypothetical protein